MYECKVGQGQYAKDMKNFRLCSLDECQNKCKEFTNCAGIDYTEDKCNDKTCLAEEKWCDNVEDCSNGEDEQNCCKGKGY